MKIPSLALACVLLSSTALVPSSLAQSPSTMDRGFNTGSPSEPSPSSSSAATSRTGSSSNSAYHDDDDDDDDDRGMGSQAGPDIGMRDRWRGDDGRGDRRMGGRMSNMDDHDMDERPMGDGMRMYPALMRMHMRMMGGQQQRGARLKLKRGDASMDVRCPAGEQIGACIDAVGKLMDRLQAMPQNR